MGYVVTGATGFIGGRLVERLLERSGPIYCLVREGSLEKLEQRIRDDWGTTKRRIKPLVGDLTDERLGLSKARIRELRDDVDHVFHLAAIYDMTASAETQRAANVEGTRHVVQFVNELKGARLHHVSSIAAAGRYDGTFTEDMFSEADEGLDQPYFATKHESEGVVRREAKVPWRVYRPGIVVGDSRTGQIDKIDGPYYFFKLIQRLRQTLPPWFPLIGLEGRTVNLVPVDYVVAALDHIAHLDDDNWDGKAFHLVDPDPHTAGEVMNIFAEAAHAPQFSMRVDPRAVDLVPRGVRKVIGSLPPVENTKKAVLSDLGIPEGVFTYIDWPTTFDDTNTQAALMDSGIACPDLEDYAWKLWDHWERHLDPDLYRDRSLQGAIGQRRILITGASGGIGREVALLAGEAGAHVLLVSRTREKLEEVAEEVRKRGGQASVYPCDLADMDDIDRMCKQVTEDLGGVDVIVNNAGRSIRRSVRLSLDRFHDYERTMQLNYFGPVKLILNLLPPMLEGSGGHIINVSSIGVQTNTPRFSAYVASKAALDAFSRCIASEIIDDDVHITTVYMPLVRTPMIAPTKMYDYFPALSPEEAGQMICDAMIDRPKRVATGLGNFGQTMYAISPKLVDQVLHTAYRLFPDSAAAKGKQPEQGKSKDEKASAEGVAFAHLLKGIHW